MRTYTVIVSTYIVIIALVSVCLISCTGTSSTTAKSTTPTTTAASYTPLPTTTQPPDTPKFSKDETTALIWSKLPSDLQPNFQKTQFKAESGNASYTGNGKWQYQITGETRATELLPTRIFELTPGYWVENHSQQVTTRNLLISADYFENTGILNLQPVQITSENTSIETLSQTSIIAQKLKLNWISGSTTGYDFRVEGSVTNTGIVALQNVIFEVTTYDSQGKYLRTDNLTMTPAKIDIGQLTGFCLIVPGANLKQSSSGSFGYYDYRFLTSAGKQITVQK
jgi:hypothetical protein